MGGDFMLHPRVAVIGLAFQLAVEGGALAVALENGGKQAALVADEDGFIVGDAFGEETEGEEDE